MRRSRIIRLVGTALLLVCLSARLALGANGPGWYIELNTPAAGRDYARSTNITNYSGDFGWPAGEDSIDIVAMYVMTGNPDPDIGLSISQTGATCSIDNDPDGGGTGTFSGQDTNPTLTVRPSAGTFYITAVPQNAASGEEYSLGLLLYADVTENAI